MPEGSLFTDQPVGSVISPCRQAAGAAPAKKWDVDCILKILCKNDKKIVDQLAKTTVTTLDDYYFNDPYFDGKKWTIKQFPAAGSSNSSKKSISIRSDMTCEGAVDTFYHEIWHQNQPAGMGWPEPSEDDAYYNTEQWLIDRGLPGNDSIRTKDPVTGKIVPDKKEIRIQVQKDYPGPPPPVKGVPQPKPIDKKTKTNETKVFDPVTGKTFWRPSKAGDTFDGPAVFVNKKVVDPKQWKCP